MLYNYYILTFAAFLRRTITHAIQANSRTQKMIIPHSVRVGITEGHTTTVAFSIQPSPCMQIVKHVRNNRPVTRTRLPTAGRFPTTYTPKLSD